MLALIRFSMKRGIPQHGPQASSQVQAIILNLCWHPLKHVDTFVALPRPPAQRSGDLKLPRLQMGSRRLHREITFALEVQARRPSCLLGAVAQCAAAAVVARIGCEGSARALTRKLQAPIPGHSRPAHPPLIQLPRIGKCFGSSWSDSPADGRSGTQFRAPHWRWHAALPTQRPPSQTAYKLRLLGTSCLPPLSLKRRKVPCRCRRADSPSLPDHALAGVLHWQGLAPGGGEWERVQG